MPNDELKEMISQFPPGELHGKLKEIGHDATTNVGKLEMALALMKAGIPINQIPIDDQTELTKMYETNVLKMDINSNSEEQKVLKQLFSSNIDKHIKLSKIIDSLDNKGYIQLADRLEHIANLMDISHAKYALTPTMDISYLSDEPQKLLEPEIPDEEIEDEITPKDINNLLDKFEAILDASGDEFDPDLLPIAKKVLLEILDKFEKIEKQSEETEEQPEIQYKTPQIAHIAKSMTKLSNIADQSKNQNIINDIDFIINNYAKILNIM